MVLLIMSCLQYLLIYGRQWQQTRYHGYPRWIPCLVYVRTSWYLLLEHTVEKKPIFYFLLFTACLNWFVLTAYSSRAQAKSPDCICIVSMSFELWVKTNTKERQLKENQEKKNHNTYLYMLVFFYKCVLLEILDK